MTHEGHESARQADLAKRRDDLEWVSQWLSRDALLVVEPRGGIIVDADANFCRLVGVGHPEECYRGVDQYLVPDRRAWHADERAKWVANPLPVLMDHRQPLQLVRHDGSLVTVGISLVKLGTLALVQIRNLSYQDAA